MANTKEERREQKRLAECLRRAKIKNDPELYKRYKEKDRERYAQKKAAGKIIKMHERPLREQKSLRKYYREHSKKHYKKKKQALNEDVVELLFDDEIRKDHDPLRSPQAVSSTNTLNPHAQNMTTLLLQSPKHQVMFSPAISDLNPPLVEPEFLSQKNSQSPCSSSPVKRSSKLPCAPKSSINQRLRSRIDKTLSSTDNSNPQTHQSKPLSHTSVFKKYKYRVNKEFNLLHQRLAELQKKNYAYEKIIQRLRVRKSNETVKDTDEEEAESSYKDESRSTEYKVESIIEKLKTEIQKLIDDGDENSIKLIKKEEY